MLRRALIPFAVVATAATLAACGSDPAGAPAARPDDGAPTGKEVLQRLRKEAGRLLKGRVAFLGVNSQEGRSDAAAFLKQLPVPLLAADIKEYAVGG